MANSISASFKRTKDMVRAVSFGRMEENMREDGFMGSRVVLVIIVIIMVLSVKDFGMMENAKNGSIEIHLN